MITDQRIVVVGATGRVGREMLSILEKKGVDSKNVACAASARSDGTFLPYGIESIRVYNLESVNFSKYDIALFSAGSEISSKYAPIAASAGCIVIDNTSYFRMNNDISLVVPEINFDDYLKSKNKHIIANPNCSTIQMVMALKPLHDIFNLLSVVVSTYQAVSGAGQKGIDELERQTKDPSYEPNCFQKQIANNVLPKIGKVNDSGYSAEEEKMMYETLKILNTRCRVTATCVRVPVFVGHSISVVATFEKDVDLCSAIRAIEEFPGVSIIDCATPIDCAHMDDVFISRLRKHPSCSKTLSFWCVSDNLRKGAALNSIQIAEMVVAYHTNGTRNH